MAVTQCQWIVNICALYNCKNTYDTFLRKLSCSRRRILTLSPALYWPLSVCNISIQNSALFWDCQLKLILVAQGPAKTKHTECLFDVKPSVVTHIVLIKAFKCLDCQKTDQTFFTWILERIFFGFSSRPTLSLISRVLDPYIRTINSAESIT